MFCVDPATGEGYMPLAYYALMAEQITELLAQIATLKLAIAKAALILKAFEHAPLPDHEVVAGVVRERCGSDSPG